MKASDLVNRLAEFIERYGDRLIVDIHENMLVALATSPSDDTAPFVCIFALDD